MKQTLAIDFEFDLQTIRRSLAVITGRSFTDEELLEKFVKSDKVVVNTEEVMGGESLQMCIAFLGTLIANRHPELLAQDGPIKKDKDE